MQKGYFFTIDALIAIILIIIFSSFMVTAHPATDDSKPFENYKTHTENASLVAHYKNLIPSDFSSEGISLSVPPETKNYFCAYKLEYKITTGTINKISFCKGDN